MKKVLIITYYWPPAGGTGTQRCLKFARHLPAFGWEPVIFTSAGHNQQTTDASLPGELPEGIEVHSVKAWEPYLLYRFFTGRSKKEAATPHLSFDRKPGLRDRFSRWVRDNYFIPDARRFWIRPSVRFLSQYLAENKIDAMLTSGPPHSTHLIGLALKKRFPQLKWVADFRDPWMHINAYHDAKLNSAAHEKQAELEKAVLAQADAVITVSKPICESLAAKNGAAAEKFHVITNSYDLLPAPTKKQNNKFVITHAGTLYKNRSPLVFWKMLSELAKENPAFRERLELNLTGKVEAVVLAQIESLGLRPYLRHTDFVSHREALEEMTASDLLLVLVNDVPEAAGILTGKFFEYLGAGKPVLAIGPGEGDLAEIIRETNCGFMSGYSDEQKMKEALLAVFSGDYKYAPVNREKYSAKSVTEKLAAVLDRKAAE